MRTMLNEDYAYGGACLIEIMLINQMIKQKVIM